MGAAGCDRGNPAYENDKGPPPQVVWSSPADKATGVALQQSMRVQFDRFLRPDTANRQSICIQAGPNSGCVGTSPEYDPVDRVLVAKPMAALMPNTLYNLRLVAPTKDNPGQGIRTFDDVALEDDVVLSFMTGGADAMPTLPEPKRTAEFCGLPNTTLSGCSALAACHKAGDPKADETPAGSAFQLLSDKENTRQHVAALVTNSTVAIETATAPDPTEPRRAGTSLFGQNMPYIDQGNPANSYLLYKLMIGGGEQAIAAPCLFDPAEPSLAGLTCSPSSGGVEPWVPSGAGKPPILGEHDRLWGRLVGNAMPANAAAVRTISAWIAAGASTPNADCPK